MILFLISAAQPAERTQHNPYYRALPPPPYQNPPSCGHTTSFTRWNLETSINLKEEIKNYQRFFTNLQLDDELHNIEYYKSFALFRWQTVEKEYKSFKQYLNRYNRYLVRKLKGTLGDLFTKLVKIEEFIKESSLSTPQKTTEDCSSEEYHEEFTPSEPSKKSFLEIVCDSKKKQTPYSKTIPQLPKASTPLHPKPKNPPSLKSKKSSKIFQKLPNGWCKILYTSNPKKLRRIPKKPLTLMKEIQKEKTFVSKTIPGEQKKYPKFSRQLRILTDKEENSRAEISLDESFEYNVALEQLKLLQNKFLKRNDILLETFKMHIIIFLELKLYLQAKALCDEYHTLDPESVVPLMFKMRIALESPATMVPHQLATDFKCWFDRNTNNPIHIFYYANFLQNTRSEDLSSTQEIITLFQKALLLFQTSEFKEFRKLTTVHLLLLEKNPDTFLAKLQLLNPTFLTEIFGYIPKINTDSTVRILIEELEQYVQKLGTDLSQKAGFYYEPTKDEKEIFNSFLQHRQERREKLHLTFSKLVISFSTQGKVEMAFKYATEEFDQKDPIHDSTHYRLKRDLITIIVSNCNIDDLESVFILRALLINNRFLEHANVLSETCMSKHKNNPQLYFQYIKIFEDHLKSGRVDIAKTQLKLFLDIMLPQLTDTSSHKEIYTSLARLSQQIDDTINQRIIEQLKLYAPDFLKSPSA